MECVKIYEDKFFTLIQEGLQIVTLQNSEDQERVLSPPKPEPSVTNPVNLTCSYCRQKFANGEQQREHYKLDWHRYNLKQNLLSRDPITEEQFNEKTGDVSSISGSDTSDKEDTLDNIAATQGKLFLKTNTGFVFSLYRCLLLDKKEDNIDTNSVLQRLKQFEINKKWTVLMLGGGHFAGAVFQGGNAILHKTFHCYTVRAGQGSAQGSRDNKSGGLQPKSAGASLRRYNEQSLVQHVKDILEVWKKEIAESNVIVYRATGPYNRTVLFGGGKSSILDKTDVRLRSIPFSTKRATFAEVKRVYDVLTNIQPYKSLEDAQQKFLKQISPDRERKRDRTKTSSINRAKSRETIERPLPGTLSTSSSSSVDDLSKNTEKLSNLSCNDVEISFKDCLQSFEDTLTPEQRKRTKVKKQKKSKSKKLQEQEEKRKRELIEIIRSGNIEKLITIMKSFENDEETNEKYKFINEVLDDSKNTLLHIAVIHNQKDLIEILLENEADPCLKNNKQHTPYTVTQDKEIREVFKTYAQKNPDKHNYNKAHIPLETRTPEEIAEKKLAQRKVKRQKEKEKKKENDLKKQEDLEKERFLKLSDREKRALAAERRILSQSGKIMVRCFLCAADITGKVPFEYLGNRFCTIECLKAHRLQNPIQLS